MLLGAVVLAIADSWIVIVGFRGMVACSMFGYWLEGERLCGSLPLPLGAKLEPAAGRPATGVYHHLGHGGGVQFLPLT